MVLGTTIKKIVLGLIGYIYMDGDIQNGWFIMVGL